MNTEQLRDLAFRAGFCRSDAGEFSNTIIGTTYEDALKNFAELIVRECARKVTGNEARNIFEHFGVEE